MSNPDLLQKIEEALDIIRPYLQKDEGDISILEITDDNVVKVKFCGACAICHINYQTFTTGVETVIRSHVPEVKGIVALGANNKVICGHEYL